MLQALASNNPRLSLLHPELNEKDLFRPYLQKSFYFSYFPLEFLSFYQFGKDVCKSYVNLFEENKYPLRYVGLCVLGGRRELMPQREAVKVIKEQGSQYSLTPSPNTSRNESHLKKLLLDSTHPELINIHPIIEKAMFLSGSLSTYPGVSPLHPAAGVRNLEIHPEAEKLMQMAPNMIHFHEINISINTLGQHYSELQCNCGNTSKQFCRQFQPHTQE